MSETTRARVGNVYLLRGFIGVFSAGINSLGEKINADGVRANVYQDAQWRPLASAIKDKYRGVSNPEPLVLVGHSYGADDVIRVSRELDSAGVKVDLLVLLDPVTPPAIPANVVRCQNFYQPNGAMDAFPWLRGIPVKRAEGSNGLLANVNLRKDRTDLLESNTNHFNIEKNPKVHVEILALLSHTCPPRPQWFAAVGRNAVVGGPVSHTPTPAAAGAPAPPPTINAKASAADGAVAVRMSSAGQ